MKSTVTVLALLFVSLTINAQRVKGKKGDSPSDNVQRTTWETMSISLRSYIGVRILKLDSTYTMDVRAVFDGKNLSILEGENLTLKLSNDSTIMLQALKTVTSCRGCFSFGNPPRMSEGIEMSFEVPVAIVPLLQANNVTNLKIDFTKGTEEVEIKEKNGDVVIKCLGVLK